MNKYILNNGVKVLIDKIDFFNTFSLGIWVNVGSSRESELENGYTHFLEHMLFKGTNERSYFDISYEIESLGGYLNAFTSKEYTCFYVNLANEYLETGLNILWDMVHNSTLPKSEFEKERSVVLEEIKATEDNPEDFVHDVFASKFWAGCPQGYPILGKAENISNLQRDKLLSFFKEHYKPQNLIISICGSFDETLFLKHLDKLGIGDIAKEINKLERCIKRNEVSFGKHHIERNTLEQIYTVIGFKTPSRYSEDKYGIHLLSNILGDGSSSRLFVELREKRGLCYSIYSFGSLNSENGLLGISYSTSYQNYEKFYEYLQKELKEVVLEGIDAAELARAKAQMNSSMLFSYENLEQRMNINAKNELFYNRQRNPEEIKEEIEKVSLDMINGLAQKLLILEEHTLVSLGKRSK